MRRFQRKVGRRLSGITLFLSGAVLAPAGLCGSCRVQPTTQRKKGREVELDKSRETVMLDEVEDKQQVQQVQGEQYESHLSSEESDSVVVVSKESKESSSSTEHESEETEDCEDIMMSLRPDNQQQLLVEKFKATAEKKMSSLSHSTAAHKLTKAHEKAHEEAHKCKKVVHARIKKAKDKLKHEKPGKTAVLHDLPGSTGSRGVSPVRYAPDAASAASAPVMTRSNSYSSDDAKSYATPPLQSTHKPTVHTPPNAALRSPPRIVSPTTGLLESALDERKLQAKSGTVWKRRSGFGKLSSKNAWERRRLMLHDTVLSYFMEEDTTAPQPSATANTNTSTNDAAAFKVPTSLSALKEQGINFFEQASMALPLPPYIMGSDATQPNHPNEPRGSLDLHKEWATVSPSLGHNGAPTPFALSIKIRGETKWKFAFDTHKEQLDWLVAIANVVIRKSIDQHITERAQAEGAGVQVTWKSMEQPAFAIHQSRTLPAQGEDSAEQPLSTPSLLRVSSSHQEQTNSHNAAADTATPVVPAWNDPTRYSTLTGRRVAVVCLAANLALIVSCSSFERLLITLVIFNGLLWLCFEDELRIRTQLKDPSQEIASTNNNRNSVSLRGSFSPRDNKTKSTVSKPPSQEHDVPIPTRGKIRPMAGATTVQVVKETDQNVNAAGIRLPAWRPVPGSALPVRTVGYEANRNKSPSDGLLYDCVKMDIFESNSRVCDLAKQVYLPSPKQPKGDGRWHSPDVFIVSVAIPTEAKFGSSTNDGKGFTIVLYCTMGKDMRRILEELYPATLPASTTTAKYVQNGGAGKQQMASCSSDSSLDTALGGEEKSVASASGPVSTTSCASSALPSLTPEQRKKVNAVKLFEEWCRRSPTDPTFQARFKVVPDALNLTEIGLPSYITKYKNKPVLIKRAGVTGILYRNDNSPTQPPQGGAAKLDSGVSSMEMHINFHAFPYLAKQAFSYMKENYFNKVLCNCGFVIEGRNDDELPEVVISAMQLCYPDPTCAVQAEDIFAGKFRPAYPSPTVDGERTVPAKRKVNQPRQHNQHQQSHHAEHGGQRVQQPLRVTQAPQQHHSQAPRSPVSAPQRYLNHFEAADRRSP